MRPDLGRTDATPDARNRPQAGVGSPVIPCRMDTHHHDATPRPRAASLAIAAAAIVAIAVSGAALLGQGCAQKAAQGPFAKDPPPRPPDTPPDPQEPITAPPEPPDSPPAT